MDLGRGEGAVVGPSARRRRLVTQPLPPLTVLLASPRGFCAGVERAIQAVEDTLRRTDKPVYVRHEIVHNGQVIDSLKAQGAQFVEELSEVPDGAVAIFSAHGVSRTVEHEAARRDIAVIDATCPLVRRVHVEARRHAQAGREVVVIGHHDHVEVRGTVGQIDGRVHVIGDVGEARALVIADPENIAYVTQTTLSVDDTRDIIAVLKTRFPAIKGPDTKTICYATQNRQQAVRAMTDRAERVIVCGARNSSNTNRLREVAAQAGRPALLMEHARDLDRGFIEGARVIGLTSGASAPEAMIEQALAQLALWRTVTVEEVRVTEESTRFAPVDLSALIPQRATGS
jgi:4-hydroxy-3-methylbut-2-enyl diphosphate reductase